MAKVRVKSTNINKAISDKLRGALIQTESSTKILDLVKATLRSGKLLDGSTIKALAKSTIQRRERLATVNFLDPEFSPAKSNLTLSGQFIEFLLPKFRKEPGKVVLTITPSKTSRGLQGITKRLKGISNKKKGQALIDGGRDYTKVGGSFASEVKKIIIEAIKKTLRK